MRKSNDCWIKLLQVGHWSWIIGRCSSMFLPPEVIKLLTQRWFCSIILVPRPVTEELVRKRWEGAGDWHIGVTDTYQFDQRWPQFSSQSKSLVPSIVKKIDLVAEMMKWVQRFYSQDLLRDVSACFRNATGCDMCLSDSNAPGARS